MKLAWNDPRAPAIIVGVLTVSVLLGILMTLLGR